MDHSKLDLYMKVSKMNDSLGTRKARVLTKGRFETPRMHGQLGIGRAKEVCFPKRSTSTRRYGASSKPI